LVQIKTGDNSFAQSPQAAIRNWQSENLCLISLT